MIELNDILHHLLEVVDLGIIKLPTIILLSVMLILFGLGFKKSLFSYFGVLVIFTYYFYLEMADLI